MSPGITRDTGTGTAVTLSHRPWAERGCSSASTPATLEIRCHSHGQRHHTPNHPTTHQPPNPHKTQAAQPPRSRALPRVRQLRHLPWPRRTERLCWLWQLAGGSRDHLSPQRCHLPGLVQPRAQGFTFNTSVLSPVTAHSTAGCTVRVGAGRLLPTGAAEHLPAGAQGLSDGQISSPKSSSPSDFRPLTSPFSNSLDLFVRKKRVLKAEGDHMQSHDSVLTRGKKTHILEEKKK